MNLFELSAKLSLDSSAYMSGINTAKKAVGTFGKIAAATFAAGTAAFGAFAKSAVSTGMQFDSAMSQVAATMGVTVDEIQNLRDFAKEMGATTKFSAVESAQALNYMALAGYDAEKSMKTLPTVMSLAAAGGMDLARASDMVTDAESALGLTSEQTAKMVDQMAKTASKSNTSVEQLGDAMLTIGGTANIMAGGTDRLQTVLGLMADNGIKGAEAGTHLRNMLLKLSSPTKDGQEVLQRYGVAVFDAAGNMRDMQAVMLDLRDAMASVSQEQRVTDLSNLFNARDLAAVNALLNTSEERWNELGTSIASAQGSAGAMSETQLDNLQGAMTIMKSAWEGLKIEFAEGLMPVLSKVVKRITDILSDPKVIKFISTVGEKFGALVERFVDWAENAAPIIIDAFRGIAPAVKDIFGSIGSVVGDAFNLAFKGLQKILPRISDALKKLIDFVRRYAPSVGSFLKSLLPPIRDVAKVLLNLAKTALPIIVNLAKKLAPVVQNVFNIVSKIVTAVGPLLTKLLTFAGEVLGDIIKDVSDFVQHWGPAIVGAVKIVIEILKPLLDIIRAIHNMSMKLLSPVKKILNTIGDGFSKAAKSLDDTSKAIDENDYKIDHVTKTWSRLDEEFKNSRDSALDAALAYKEIDDAFVSSYQKTEDEIRHIQDLSGELGKLVDSKGRVGKADQERAHFITDELQNLTGIEIDWNNDVIANYGDLAGAIQNVIKQKRALHLLDNAEQKADTAREQLGKVSAGITDTQTEIAGYDESLAQRRKDAEAAKKELIYATRDVADLNTDLADARAKYADMLNNGLLLAGTKDQSVISANIDALEKQLEDAQIRLATAKGQYDDILADIKDISDQRNTAYDNLSTLETSEAQYYADIAKYEEAYMLVSQGYFDEAQSLLENDIKARLKYVAEQESISESNLKAIKRDMDVAMDAYNRYKDAYERGEAGRTSEGLALAKKTADEMVEVYRLAMLRSDDAMWAESQRLGVSFADGFSAGIKSMAQRVAEEARNVAKQAVDVTKRTLQIKSPSRVTREIGQYFGEGFAEGIDDEVRAVEQSVGYMSDAAVDAFGNPISGDGAGVRATGSGRVEQLLQAILDNMGVDIVLDDGTIAGRVDRIIGQSATRKARGGA